VSVSANQRQGITIATKNRGFSRRSVVKVKKQLDVVSAIAAWWCGAQEFLFLHLIHPNAGSRRDLHNNACRVFRDEITAD